MTLTEAANLTASLVGAGSITHSTPVRRSTERTACNMDQPRRMVAVTVALSEPMHGTEIDWAQTIAAVLRLTYAGTTVEVIDSWRVDA